MPQIDYRTVRQISGPLLFVEKVRDAAYNELVEITMENGEKRTGQVLDTSNGLAVVQVFGPTSGMDITGTKVKFLGSTARVSVSDEMLGRIFNGLGEPIDHLQPVVRQTCRREYRELLPPDKSVHSIDG